jgi:prepilin-type N-terminal cleavage/methylation domain-containing protein
VHLKSQKGFSLVEALIAIAILAIGVIGTLTLQSSFGKHSADRTIINYLIDASSSALTQCQADDETGTFLSYTFENDFTVNVELDGSCKVPSDECIQRTATASARGKFFKLTTYICNFK